MICRKGTRIRKGRLGLGEHEAKIVKGIEGYKGSSREAGKEDAIKVKVEQGGKGGGIECEQGG